MDLLSLTSFCLMSLINWEMKTREEDGDEKRADAKVKLSRWPCAILGVCTEAHAGGRSSKNLEERRPVVIWWDVALWVRP